MTNRIAVGEAAPTRAATAGLRRALEALRYEPRVEQARITAVRAVIWLWGLGVALAVLSRRAAPPMFSEQLRRPSRALARITSAGAARAAGRGVGAARHLLRRPDLPLYAAAVVAAVLVGWIVGRTI